MINSTATQNASEHWLTAMKCTVCKNTPNVSPLYKCSLGHLVCMSCYTKIIYRGIPKCTECNSTNFKPVHVSQEFLQKLKMKPGIGRPRRYDTASPLLTDSNSENRTKTATNITLEKLFGLNQDQLKLLFDENLKQKNKIETNQSRNSLVNKMNIRDFGDVPSDECNNWMMKNISKLVVKNCDSCTTISKKPLVCPHSPCRKIIAQSSFEIHFKYEHGDIPRFNIDRGKELHLLHDTSVITHGSSFCLGLITVSEPYVTKTKPKHFLTHAAKKMAPKVPICTFWLMVSASQEERRNRSYVIYWMLSNNDDSYHCTLELSSQEDNIVCSCFCNTIGIHESLELEDVAQRMRCLCLTYGSLSNLLEEGSKLNLRIVVH